MTNDTPQDTDVLIVGAGPVGLSAACALSRQGVEYRIVDSKPGAIPPNESRALAIWERTLEVLGCLGVVDKVIEHGKRIHGLNMYKGGERLVRLDLDLGDVETPYPFVISLAQSDTERLLVARLAEHGRAVEWRTRLTTLEQDETGVTATLADEDGRETRMRSRWLIGCDGAHSVVRHQLGLVFEGAAYEEPFLLADVKVALNLSHDEVHVMLLPTGGAVAIFPLPQPERWRLIDASGLSSIDDPERIRERFRDLLHEQGFPDAAVEDMAWSATFRIHRRMVDRLRVGRVFVAGDAAHIHSPVGGQGMNIGIQDVFNLAWKLALAARGEAAETVLNSYHAERHPIAAQVLKGTDMATRLITLRSDLSRAVRDRLLAFVTDFQFTRRRISLNLSSLEVGYRGSPIVAEDRAGLLSALLPLAESHGPLAHHDFASGPHAGDRAPDVVLDPRASAGSPARLFDVLNDRRHSLLLFVSDVAADADAIALAEIVEFTIARFAVRIRPWLVVRDQVSEYQAFQKCERLIDTTGKVHTRYGAAAPCLYLIRPDGYIGYRSQPPHAETLRAYLARLFVV